jgi:hypothetical protein
MVNQAWFTSVHTNSLQGMAVIGGGGGGGESPVENQKTFKGPPKKKYVQIFFYKIKLH